MQNGSIPIVLIVSLYGRVFGVIPFLIISDRRSDSISSSDVTSSASS